MPPDVAATSSPQEEMIPSDEIVSQLVSMGFSENGSKRAALATNNTNADVRPTYFSV
jgi:uncharacterized UBP type Zn finger protein